METLKARLQALKDLKPSIDILLQMINALALKNGSAPSAECHKNDAVTRSRRSIHPPGYSKDYIQDLDFVFFFIFFEDVYRIFPKISVDIFSVRVFICSLLL